MPLLYETVFLPRRRRIFQQTIEKHYNLLDPAVASPPLPTSMTIPVGGTHGGKADAYVDVTWNPAETTFEQAILRWSVHGWRGLTSIRAMEARFYVNDILVSTAAFYTAEGACATRGNPEGLNIGTHFRNGRNKFSLELVGSWELVTSGIDSITATFVAQFTGKEPEVKPPPPEWMQYVKWGVIGIGAIAFIGLVVPKIVEAVRKPKG